MATNKKTNRQIKVQKKQHRKKTKDFNLHIKDFVTQ